MFGLNELLMRPGSFTPSGRDDFFDAPSQSYCSPGYWVSVAARARSRGLHPDELQFFSVGQKQYAQALGIETALREQDRYPFGRVNQGVNYSPLVVIAHRDDVDKANGDISGCVRALFPEAALQPFVHELCSVTGDLHDNVWSHGQSTGISAAQRWCKPYSNREVSFIEFALADCGVGFLRELNRSGIAQKERISTDAAAIAWCIEQGHSSKKREDDDWTQRLPEDAIGNPIGAGARIRSTENHHVGLGLFKLTSLVSRYGGELWLASGGAMLRIDRHGKTDYVHTAVPWKGVCLACRFSTDRVAQGTGTRTTDALDEALLHLLEGHQRERQ